MKAAHIITIGAAIFLIILLFFKGNTTPPKGNVSEMQRGPAGATSDPGAMRPASFDSILAKSKARLSKEVADTVSAIENKLSATSDPTQVAVILQSLSDIWGRYNDPKIATWYLAKIAKLENSEKKLTFAGSSYLELMANESSPSIQLWEAGGAVECLEKALALDSSDEDIKLKLATAYLEGTGEPMKGVQLLLGIVNEKPDDIPANLLLGRMSIKSGQIDKAMMRLETVLKQQPENTEALYFMAQAYKEKGDKKKAIELFEKCKKLINKPEFNKEIDDYINSFK